MEIYNITFSAAVSAIVGIFSFILKSYIDAGKQRKFLASAFLAEITCLIEQYEKAGGLSLLYELPDDYVYYCTMNVDDDFFTVYNKNADKLGLFNSVLVKEIVSLYVNAKGFVCTIKTWNDLVNRKESNPSKKDEQLQDYYDTLMAQYNDISEAAKKLLPKLDKVIK
jgi:hypothetical protein